ncbi:MAG: hypothetical protein DCC67_01280 [Planctomycetota bacterium]|nr:MAG: hypothetical protein DCC67_01280 [Planctomycetota bacterium]
MHPFRLELGVAALVVVGALCGSALAGGGGSRPNIVLIMSDDAGYADFGFQNQFTGQTTPLRTPNLDLLASQSVAFSNAYVASSQCALSRAGMLTGRQPDAYGYSFNALDDDRPYEGLPLSQTTLLEYAQQAGYSTGLVGKWHLGQEPAHQPQNRGVDYFFGMWEGAINYYRNDASATKIRRGDAPVAWWNEPSFNNIPHDPTRGRYLTDALGDEASQFIAERAGVGQPFFLYTALNAPHSPFDSKAQDYAQFPALSDQRRQVAAMTLAMDRAIGNILARIDDPNGDGDQADSIADNTIVLFLNDNGGPNGAYSNSPLAGLKGTAWEGGLRTPMLIRAPDAAPGVFHETVTSLDFFPTLMNLMGQPVTTPTDGVDLMPYLYGQLSGPVHDAIYFRNRVNYGAIRKGDWKLVKPDAGSTWKLFRLNPDGTGETVDVLSQHPDIVEELIKDYVAFDVTLDKPRNSGPSKVHFNDLFIRRNEAGAVTSWAHGAGWWDGDAPTQIMSISRDDPSPNMILAFRPNNAADYRSTNDVNRASGISRANLNQGLQDLRGLGEVMLNEIRLEGTFSGSANRKATIDGKPLLLVNDLQGKPPTLRLDAMQAAGQFTYTYNVDLNMYLYHDFVIEGDGNANFRIGGAMSSFDPASGVTKRGSSSVTLSGYNTFTGPAIVEAGQVTLDGANAAIDGASRIEVYPGATLKLQNGTIKTPLLDVNAGDFEVSRGTVFADQVFNIAGTVSVGQSGGTATLWGNYWQPSGTLKATLDGHAPGSAPLLLVSGQAELGGSLVLDYDGTTLIPVGSSITILTAARGVSGLFQDITLPSGTFWSVLYSPFAVSIRRESSPSTTPIVFADFDADGDVDGGDFLIWQRNLWGSGPAGDANRDGLVDYADYDVWRNQVGAAPQQALPGVHAAPEPSALLLGLLAAGSALAAARERASCRRAT